MKSSSKIFYNSFSFFYPVVDWFLKQHKQKLFYIINKEPLGELLEIGVGRGQHLQLYLKHNITAIDNAENMLEKAMEKGSLTKKLLLMNAEKLDFDDNSFEYVVMCHVIAVLDNPDVVMKEVYRVLKPKGKLFILNHITPNNGLYVIDKMFNPIAKLFHFQSLFHVESIKSLQQFTLLKEINVDKLSYFKILIYTKA